MRISLIKQVFVSARALLILLALLLALTPTMQAQFRTVTVQNAPNNPVPVQQQGTVAIAGSVNLTGTSNVSVTNTPSVQVTNVPAVTISGTPGVNAINLPLSNRGATPNGAVFTKNVDEPSRQPFQTGFVMQVAANQSYTQTSFAVPAGKELVIEYINVAGELPNGVLNAGIQTTAGGAATPFPYDIPTIFQFTDTNNSNFFDGTSHTRIYADPGTTVTLTISTLGTNILNGTGPTGFNVSGYLVDVP